VAKKKNQFFLARIKFGAIKGSSQSSLAREDGSFILTKATR